MKTKKCLEIEVSTKSDKLSDFFKNSPLAEVEIDLKRNKI